MSKQQTFGRSRPSIAYELAYRKQLQSLVEEMRQDVQKELKSYLKKELAQDGMPIRWRQIMKLIRQRWYKTFDKKSRELAKWMADKTKKRTAAQVMRKLKEMGMTLEPRYSKKDKELINEIVRNNVAMIKSIPQEYLNSVQQAVSVAFTSGYDSQYLTEHLAQTMERLGERSNNRAALIARDQINKATQQFAVAEAQAVGATKGRWIHVQGKYSSRITHIHMNNQIFNLSEGIYDKAVGRNVMPGQLPYCNCQFETLIPGFEQ